jgi:hypothetical protein
MTSHIFVVQLNAVEGREDEFNEWYDNAHIPEALAVDGFVAAHRFKISDTQRPGTDSYPYRYLTIYEMEGDPAAALEAQLAAIPGMRMSTALGDDRKLHLFDAGPARCCPATVGNMVRSGCDFSAATGSR